MKPMSALQTLIGFILLYFLEQSAKSTWSGKFWKNRIQNSLVPETKIVKLQNKISSFGNLFGQNSHVPVSSTMPARLVSQRNLSCTKINLAFRTGHATWKSIYFTPAKATFSCYFFALTRSSVSEIHHRQLQTRS